MPQETIHVLHLDDSSYFLEVIRLLMTSLSKALRWQSVILPIEALEMVKHQDYDYVICDYGMPEINGLQFYQKLRQMDYKNPFIFLTARDLGNHLLKNQGWSTIPENLDISRLSTFFKSVLEAAIII